MRARLSISSSNALLRIWRGAHPTLESLRSPSRTGGLWPAGPTSTASPLILGRMQHRRIAVREDPIRAEALEQVSRKGFRPGLHRRRGRRIDLRNVVPCQVLLPGLPEPDVYVCAHPLSI